MRSASKDFSNTLIVKFANVLFDLKSLFDMHENWTQLVVFLIGLCFWEGVLLMLK